MVRSVGGILHNFKCNAVYFAPKRKESDAERKPAPYLSRLRRLDVCAEPRNDWNDCSNGLEKRKLGIFKFRETKPLFTLDFWNDGEYTEGCIAGGRRYLHVNANGDMEPCAFIHYSDSNIREKTILEALKSPLFMNYHDGQPFNENYLRPCPLLDNPDALVGMVERSGAYSTDFEDPEDVVELSGKTRVAAEKWASTADELWACAGHCAGCAKSDSAS
jgi:MoaA/NifB/PqqE/SkfB family radical SAM enzyme